VTSKAYELLLRTATDSAVVDTHDHLRPPSDIGVPMTVTNLLLHTYVSKCIRLPDGSVNGIGDRLEDVVPVDYPNFAEIARRAGLSSYFVWLMRGLSELYELPSPVTGPAAFEKLSAELPKRYEDPSWITTVLDKAKIRSVVWDPFWKPGTTEGPDPRLVPSLRLNSSVVAFHPDASDYEGTNIIRDWADSLDIAVDSLSDLEELIERVIGLNLAAGARSLKSALAYQRSLSVGPARRADAAAIFGTSPDRITPEQRVIFGDYVTHLFMEAARDHDLVVQVHTGFARLGDSNPMRLIPLIETYHDVVFDLFHGGYPWVHDVAALAQNYPNVRLNLTWLPQISTDVAVSSLKEWLQVAPQVNRISWGADCHTVEEMYGALLAARHVTARALADLVESSYIDIDLAVLTVQSVLEDAGESIYGVGRLRR
jgi:uncharacterized protein